MWHSHRYTCSIQKVGFSPRENRSCRKPANIPPAVREAPSFRTGRMSPLGSIKKNGYRHRKQYSVGFRKANRKHGPLGVVIHDLHRPVVLDHQRLDEIESNPGP